MENQFKFLINGDANKSNKSTQYYYKRKFGELDSNSQYTNNIDNINNINNLNNQLKSNKIIKTGINTMMDMNTFNNMNNQISQPSVRENIKYNNISNSRDAMNNTSNNKCYKLNERDNSNYNIYYY